MKSYVITVNGVSYDVTVEEVSGAKPQKQLEPVEPAAKPEPVEKKEAASSASSQGSVKITAGTAGKVFKLIAQPGQAVKAGDSVLVVEAMKMEIPVVAPQDGTIATVEVKTGDTVEAGALLATMN